MTKTVSSFRPIQKQTSAALAQDPC